MTDKEALDRLAELFRLPEWQLNGSGADFIEEAATIVGLARDTTTDPAATTLAYYGVLHDQADA